MRLFPTITFLLIAAPVWLTAVLAQEAEPPRKEEPKKEAPPKSDQKKEEVK